MRFSSRSRGRRRAVAPSLLLLCLGLASTIAPWPATANGQAGRGGSGAGAEEYARIAGQAGQPVWPAEQRPRVRSLRLPSGRIAVAAQHQNAHLYVQWDFSTGDGGETPHPTGLDRAAGARDAAGLEGEVAGFWNVDQVMWTSKKASSTYWAQLWSWTDAPYGGYIGLQTNGNRFDGSTGETAIFSLWNASAASGEACGEFDGEGNGFSCRIPFKFRNNVRYRLRVQRLHTDPAGQWWGGWIRSSRTGHDYHIGDIRVGSSHTAMSAPSNFSEYFGRAVACWRVPVSKVNWTQPAANRRSDGSYQYHSSYAGFSGGRCTSGAVTPRDYGWTSGVAVRLGGR
jgi:hypothetical protein